MRVTVTYTNPLTDATESVLVRVRAAETDEPSSQIYTIARLMEDAGRRLSVVVGENVKLARLTNSSGATLLPEDEVSEYVEDGEQLEGFSQEQLDKTREGLLKEKEEREKLRVTDEAKEGEEEHPKDGFSVRKKLVKGCDGEMEEQTFIVIEDANLRSSINQYTSDDAFYEERPEVDPDTLLCHLDQFKSNVETYNCQNVLAPLVAWLEKRYKGINDKIERMLTEQKISFNTLWHLFTPGKKVWGREVGLVVAGEVKTAKYMRGFFPGLLVTIKVIKSSGQAFLDKDHQFYIPSFAGTKKLDELPVQLLHDEMETQLKARGRRFQALALGAHYKVCAGHMLYRNGWCVVKFKADGRVMVDTTSFTRVDPGYDEFSDHSSLYALRGGSGSADLAQLNDDQLFMTWPTLGGFSFTAKKWGEVIVDHLTDVVFDDRAFDRLVLAPEKKNLVRSLVANNSNGNNSKAAFSDVITGKGGGCIFLLHGKPGVGKTLTAEAVAELLHRPLYSVSVGELGTSTSELETRLKEILEVASTWDAVILIDEADIFLERRSEDNIKRNAMVGIFLRLLEYHQGVLFLTTNMVKSFDPAFHSRISVALKYSDLDFASRRKIWANLLDAAGVDIAAAKLDLERLAAFELNGRQIRTIIRLALSLAQAEGHASLADQHLERTINVSLQFKHDLDAMTADDCI